MKRRRRDLSGEEQRLWASIARTAQPLRGKSLPDVPPAREEAEQQAAPSHVASKGPSAPAPIQPVARGRTAAMPPPLHPIERPVRRKIGKGRIALEDRIDLHGQTEAVAHVTLLFFLRRAQGRGLRHVLVITGRGASFGSTGTLKRALPHWFSTPEFRGLVAGFEAAERGHGGAGAFYVRVRRP